jgi:hypothetical protein
MIIAEAALILASGIELIGASLGAITWTSSAGNADGTLRSAANRPRSIPSLRVAGDQLSQGEAQLHQGLENPSCRHGNTIRDAVAGDTSRTVSGRMADANIS